MANDKIKIVIGADDKFSDVFKRFNAQLDSSKPKTDRLKLSLTEINQGLELMRKAWRLVSGAMLAVLETGDKFRRYRILLEQVEGSTQGAAKAMKDLQQMALKTPSTLATLTDSFVKLKSAGVEDTKATLQGLSDAVAAFGGGDQELKRASVAIQQMAGKGVISMEELRQQLGEAIPTATKIMAREMGMSMKDFVKQVSLGAVDAQEGIAAMTRGFQKDFDGASERMMDTWMGATSNLTDSWDQFLSALSETGFLDVAIDTVQALTRTVVELAKIIRENKVEITKFFRLISGTFFGGFGMDTTRPSQNLPDQGLPPALKQLDAPQAADKSAFKLEQLKAASALEIELAMFQAEELARIDMEAWEKAKAFDQLNRDLDLELKASDFERKRALEEEHHKKNLDVLTKANASTEKENKAHEKRVTAIKTAESNARLAVTADAFGTIASAAAAFHGRQSALFKAAASIQATIGAYLSFNKMMSEPLLPFPVNMAAAGAALAVGLANVQAINQAHGGIDNVPRESTFLLSKGERVIQPEQNRDLTRFLSGNGGSGESGSSGLTINIDKFTGNFNDDSTDRMMGLIESEKALGFAS